MKFNIVYIVLVLAVTLALCFASASAERFHSNKRPSGVDRALHKLNRLEKVLADTSSSLRCNCVRAPCPCDNFGLKNKFGALSEEIKQKKQFIKKFVETKYPRKLTLPTMSKKGLVAAERTLGDKKLWKGVSCQCFRHPCNC